MAERERRSGNATPGAAEPAWAPPVSPGKRAMTARKSGDPSRAASRNAPSGSAEARTPARGESIALVDVVAEIAHLPPPEQITPDLYPRLRQLFDAVPDEHPEYLQVLLELRFRVRAFSGSAADQGVAWDAPGLRELWRQLELLPEEHVRGNSSLDDILRVHSPGGPSGAYAGGPDYDVLIGYETAEMGQLTELLEQPGDPLYGVNQFDNVALHEVGHAVDEESGFSSQYCMGNPAGGGWATIDVAILASVLAVVSQGPIFGLGEVERDAVIAALQAEIDAGGIQFQSRLDALVNASVITREQADACMTDSAIQVLTTMTVDDEPWLADDGGGVTVGGRIYQEAYPGEWVSYDPAARARKVSNYQFRHYMEWFAEAYTAYYFGGHIGQRLGARDAATKAFFDEHVDPQGGRRPAAPAGAAPLGGASASAASARPTRRTGP